MSKDTQDNVGMSYLDTNATKLFKTYFPLVAFLFVLLFPFYWMASQHSNPITNCCRAMAILFGSLTPRLRTLKSYFSKQSTPSGCGTLFLFQ